MKSFIRNFPKTIEGQKNWIVKKAIERSGFKSICTDMLKHENLPVQTISELYELVSLVIIDTEYYEG